MASVTLSELARPAVEAIALDYPPDQDWPAKTPRFLRFAGELIKLVCPLEKDLEII